MTRQDLITCREYWESHIEINLYNSKYDKKLSKEFSEKQRLKLYKKLAKVIVDDFFMDTIKEIGGLNESKG